MFIVIRKNVKTIHEITATHSDGLPNVLLIQRSMVAWQRYHTLKELHFLAEYLVISIIINNNLNYVLKIVYFINFHVGHHFINAIKSKKSSTHRAVVDHSQHCSDTDVVMVC